MSSRIISIVGSENISEKQSDLEAYSYSGADPDEKPAMVVWPRTAEEIRKLVLYANQTRTPLVIRGSGTSTTGGSTGKNAIIISLERMNSIIRLDLKKQIVEAEAGMSISRLNQALEEFNMQFPIKPLNQYQSLGSMAALNTVSAQSQQLGDMEKLTEEIEFIDGTGKHYYTKKKEPVIGKEGIAGIITRLRLKISELHPMSMEISVFQRLSDMLGRARQLQKDLELNSFEFIDLETAEKTGIMQEAIKSIKQEKPKQIKYMMISAYASMKGNIKKIKQLRSIKEKIDSVHSTIRKQGYYHIVDARVELEKAYDLIEWCGKNNVRLHGHLGMGIFYAYFKKQDKDLIKTFRSFVRRINGVVGRISGFGTANKDFVNPVKKKKLVKLKEEYDYNNILNPGKMIDYK